MSSAVANRFVDKAVDYQACATTPDVHGGAGEDVRRRATPGAADAYVRDVLHARKRKHP